MSANRVLTMSEQFWLSYGGGVNSTALAVLLAGGRFPKYENWRIVFSDTGEEKPETYAFIKDFFDSVEDEMPCGCFDG